MQLSVSVLLPCQVAVPEGEDRGKAKVEATDRFNEITQQLSALSNNFSNNALDSTAAFKLLVTDKKGLGGLPESFLAQAAQRVCHSFPVKDGCMHSTSAVRARY